MVKSRRFRTAGLSLAALMAQVVPSTAQSLLEAAPAVTQTQTAPSESILSTRQAPIAAERKETVHLVPFEQSASHFRLEGEDDVARFTFNLAADQVSSGGSLALSYKSAVSVLPDTSVMDVTVNGTAAGSFQIASPNAFKAETIKIAGEFLTQGRNEVILRARQFHRVDCSLEATYELWSELDPSSSGFIAETGHAFTALNDVLTVARDVDGVTDIRLILPQAATAEMLNDAAPVLQSLALFLNRDDIAVSVGDTPGTGPGIDLYVSTDKTRARLQQAASAGMPYGLSVKASGEPGRAVVSLRGATRADMSAQLLTAIRGPWKDSLDSGIFAPGAGTIHADASSRYDLGDAGYETRVFTGRLSRTAFNMVMPADFYPADYATVGLRLHAATSPGLNHKAQLLVRVNDRVVTSYPFQNAQGEQFDGKLIEIPLRAFRPGVNKVELLAELPMASDAACSAQLRDDTRPRFMLLRNTAIEVPPLARIGRLPDIGALSGNAYPYADGKPFDVFVERPDAQSVGAAFTMLQRLALAARNPLNAEIRLGRAVAASGRNALVVTTQNAFADLGTAGKTAFPPAAFDAQGAMQAMPDADPMQTAAISNDVLLQAAVSGQGDDDPGALLDAFRKSTEQPDALSWGSRLSGWFGMAGARFGKWLNYDDGSGDVLALRPGQSLMTLSQIRAPEGDSTWTVIHAQSPRDIALGVRRLVEPAVWSRLDGGSAEVATAGLLVTSMPAGTHFVSGIPDYSPANIRRLAAAWFSDNFQFYVLLIVVSMGIFAVWLGRAVPRKGVRSDQ